MTEPRGKNAAAIDTVVVGGGPAGMMAAITAAERGAKVVLFERNTRVGMKLGITGKGRCNITNNCDVKTVVANTPRGGSFLYSALSAFPPSAVVEWFESMGVATVTERGQRVFPASNRAGDVVAALKRRLARAGVDVRNGRVDSLVVEDGCCKGVRLYSRQAAGGTIEQRCKGVVLATGGLSYPKTGSTGDGYRLAAVAGHTVTPPRASIVPLESSSDFCQKLAGLTLTNVKVIAFTAQNRRVFEDFGELLFTHFGVSGPVVLSASAHLTEFPCHLQIDLKPALDEQKLDARLVRDFAAAKTKTLTTVCAGLVPRAMIAPLLCMAGLEGDVMCGNVTKEERRRLLCALKGFRVEISGARPIDEAVVTSGGVKTDEIDPKTMQSKLCCGLYFAGEIIDADAYTGGFNLQIAWSTGYAAGLAQKTEGF